MSWHARVEDEDEPTDVKALVASIDRLVSSLESREATLSQSKNYSKRLRATTSTDGKAARGIPTVNSIGKMNSLTSTISAADTGYSSESCACAVMIEVDDAGDTESNYDLRKRADAGWTLCSRRLREHNEKVVKAWKEEIDALLTFAGLFSAVVTAFNVAFVSSIIGLDDAATTVAVSPPSATSIWINTLWLSSLVLSLSGASIGIVVRQWLKHFITPTPYDPKHSAYIHYLRWDLGVIRWHVPEILDLLPVCLQLAVILFLIGLVGLLWGSNRVVFSIIAGQVGLLFLLAIYTTTFPAWKPNCPYKSPQARVFSWIVQWLNLRWKSLSVLISTIFRQLWIYITVQLLQIRSIGWIVRGLDIRWRKAHEYTLTIIYALLELVHHRDSEETERYKQNGVPEKNPADWLELEKVMVTAENRHHQYWELTSEVTEKVLSRAHQVLMDSSFVHDVIHPCMMEPGFPVQHTLGDLLQNIMNQGKLTSALVKESVGDIAVDLASRLPHDLLKNALDTCGDYVVSNLDPPGRLHALQRFLQADSRRVEDEKKRDNSPTQLRVAGIRSFPRTATSAVVDFFGSVVTANGNLLDTEDNILTGQLAMRHLYIQHVTTYTEDAACNAAMDDAVEALISYKVHDLSPEVATSGLSAEPSEEWLHAFRAWYLALIMSSCMPTGCLHQHLWPQLSKIPPQFQVIIAYINTSRETMATPGPILAEVSQLESACTALHSALRRLRKAYDLVLKAPLPGEGDEILQRRAKVAEKVELIDGETFTVDVRSARIEALLQDMARL